MFLELKKKVIALYARGMSTRDISQQIEELYGFSLSAEMVSKITDRIAPEIKEWQTRPLEPIYTLCFLWMQYTIKLRTTEE